MIHINLGLSSELQWRDCVINISLRKPSVTEFQTPWFDSDCEKIIREKDKWRAKAIFGKKNGGRSSEIA